jgi:hypothetical protein
MQFIKQQLCKGQTINIFFLYRIYQKSYRLFIFLYIVTAKHPTTKKNINTTVKRFDVKDTKYLAFF